MFLRAIKRKGFDRSGAMAEKLGFLKEMDRLNYVAWKDLTPCF
jgi:hypothetical protein